MADYRHAIRRMLTSTQRRADAKPLVSFRFGTVSGVVAGGASDGGALATVTVLGTPQQMAYLTSYTPAQGDKVLVLFVLRYPVVLGRIAGLPSY